MSKTDQLMSDFVKNYMGKIFYFCLKKTGHQIEADDISSDISFCIFSQLRKGTEPQNFPAWVWQIARNRYRVWAIEKRKRNEAVLSIDGVEYELESDVDVESEFLQSEDIALLKRELAFISSDYRNIVVSYYLEDMSVSDIASALDVPVGTVKSKLFRARNILKEGMSMAREFGVRSYKPEEISFLNNCSSFGDYGQPWRILYHSLYKNIFLEVYNNPETAEEIALQLGIALPYMEDELEYLTRETFLEKRGNKYETAFPILSKETQIAVQEKIDSSSAEITKLIEKLVDDFNSACNRVGCKYFGEYQNYDDAKWILLMRVFDVLNYVNGNKTYTKRPDNGNWDISGRQEAGIKDVPYVGLHGSGSAHAASFQQYKYSYKRICDMTPQYLKDDEAKALMDVVNGECENCSQASLDALLKYGYIKKNGDAFEPCIVIFDNAYINESMKSFSEDEKNSIRETANKIRSLLADVNSFAKNAVKNDIPDSYKSNEHFYNVACDGICMSRHFIFDRAISDGWLKYDENTSRAVGAYVFI